MEPLLFRRRVLCPVVHSTSGMYDGAMNLTDFYWNQSAQSLYGKNQNNLIHPSLKQDFGYSETPAQAYWIYILDRPIIPSKLACWIGLPAYSRPSEYYMPYVMNLELYYYVPNVGWQYGMGLADILDQPQHYSSCSSCYPTNGPRVYNLSGLAQTLNGTAYDTWKIQCNVLQRVYPGCLSLLWSFDHSPVYCPVASSNSVAKLGDLTMSTATGKKRTSFSVSATTPIRYVLPAIQGSSTTFTFNGQGYTLDTFSADTMSPIDLGYEIPANTSVGGELYCSANTYNVRELFVYPPFQYYIDNYLS